MEALDDTGRQPRLELQPAELVRDAVVVPADFDVIIEIDPDLAPLGQFVALGGKRLEGRPVECLVLGAARPRELSERPGVEVLEKPADRCV